MMSFLASSAERPEIRSSSSLYAPPGPARASSLSEAALMPGLEGLFLPIESLYFFVEGLFLLLNPSLVALKLGASFPYLPFLLVAFSNELIFRLYQDFFLLRFGLFDRVPFNPLRLLFGGGELESGVQPADHPSKNQASNGKGDKP